MGKELLTVRKTISRMPAGAEGAHPNAVANAYFHFIVESPKGILSDADMLQAVQDSGAFDFWMDPSEDSYSLEDGEPV